MKIWILPLLFFVPLMLPTSATLGQAKQMVKVSSVDFDSDFERKVFENLNLSTDALSLLLATDAEGDGNLPTAVALLDQIESDLAKPMAKKKTVEQKAILVQEHLHKKYLHKYRMVANFQELLQDGTYNCVNSAALYALVFDRFSIPYQIYKTPDHVYLVADPASQSPIRVETTASQSGVFIPEEQIRLNMSEYFLETKMTSQENGEESKTEEVFFEGYEDGDIPISLRDLAGLQYMNDALIKLKSMDFKRGFHQYKKAWLIYPNPPCHLMLFFSSAAYYGSAAEDRLVSLERLVEACLLKPPYLQMGALGEEIEKVTEEILKENHEKAMMLRLLEILAPLEDEAASADVRFKYHLHCADDALAFERYDSSYYHASQALQIHPDRKKVQGYLANVRTRSLMIGGNPQTVIDSLAEDEKKYPFFAESEIVHTTRFFAYAEMARAKFSADETQAAEKYLKKMHELEELRPVGNHDEAIAWAYSSAVHSYVRQFKYEKARYYLEKGLELAPFNEKMNSTKRIFKKELGVE